ncbi:ribosome recycling factor [Microgenomates group bacterium RBG_19FT_COMBO_39_10]|nr:MAG: ribosome recycling factor [Microgenomates group bacterium RBG_19FT_COMBO_39_10]
MEKVLDLLRQELVSLKVGRATPALVEQIQVEAYETKMPLVELATIASPESNQLLITPFDQAITRNIEKALSLDRDLGLNPVVDGEAIRLVIPPLNEERRKELVKVLGQKLESGRVMIRQVRQDKMQEIRSAFENKEISEDEKFRREKELQEITNEFNQKIAEIGKQKEDQLLSI